MSQLQEHKDIVRLEKFPAYDEKEPLAGSISEFEAYHDLRLWQEFKRGSRAAFIFIYHKYFDRIYNYAHQFTRDSDLVKDCIQDLFIELNHSRNRLSDTDCIHLYLYKALKRKIFRTLKKQKKVVDGFEDSEHNGFNIELSVEQKIINRQIADEQILKLNSSVNRLTNRQREAIFYFYYEGFSINQVKELLEMQNLKATQNLIYKAVKELRKLLTFLLIGFSFIA